MINRRPDAEQRILLLPDAGPLTTLAYADALDLLFKPAWPLALVDMVLHEVTRNETPTSHRLGEWAKEQGIEVLSTRVCARYEDICSKIVERPRKANLGELAIQEVMNGLALELPARAGVFLFEDHKIARASFLLPDTCRKVSTRAFLTFLEQRGWLESAAEIERRAIRAGRRFSQLRFPP